MKLLEKYYLLASLSGLLLTLGQGPFYFIFLLPLAACMILHVLSIAKKASTIFFCGWLCGLLYFGSGLYWIANSLFSEGSGQFIWLWPFCVLGIPAVLALYIGVVFLLTTYFPNNYIRALALGINWVVIELVRSYFPLPFPWHLVGYAAAFNISFLQLAAYVGVYGLSLILLTLAALCYYKNTRLLSICMFAALWLLGQGQLQSAQNLTIGNAPQGNVRIVQPSFAIKDFYDPVFKRQAVLHLLEASSKPAAKELDLLIWPEGGFPYTLEEKSPWLHMLGSYFPASSLIFGSDYLSDNNQQGKYKIFNSMFFIDNTHPPSWRRYDKQILVPFGEYIPQQILLPMVKKIARGIGDGFTPGTKGQQLLTLFDNKKAIMAICYEIIFTSHFAKSSKEADFIVNITNDAWFGDSSGPYQHLAMAQMRAVETGLPVLRAANNGISAIINAQGQILQSLALNAKSTLDTEIPTKNANITFYQKYFNQIFSIITCIFFIIHIGRIVLFLYSKKS